MKSFFISPLLVATLIGSSVHASGWLSGGSELLKDARNPWFINNTTTVKYCIVVDEANFGVPMPTLKDQVAKAFAFWKNELSSAITQSFSTFGKLKFANQDFVETSCSNDVDIHFQFGVLDERQKEFLKNPTEFAAVTVRTDYSRIHLRGKGFIYISPIRGPLAYKAEGVIPDAWTKENGRYLQLALFHELGHVFGIPHMGSRLGGLMSEDFIESSISLAYQKLMYEYPESAIMSLPKKRNVICSDGAHLKVWTDFFELSEDEPCIEFQLEHVATDELYLPTTLKVFARKSKTEAPRAVGTASLKMTRFFPTFGSLIWLTDEQTVLPKGELGNFGMNGIMGIALFSFHKQGTFETVRTKTKKHVSVRFEQGTPYFTIESVNAAGEIIAIL